MQLLRALAFTLPLALLPLAACADKGADQYDTTDSSNATAVIEVPQNPMVTSIELGRAIDADNHILGGGVEKFPEADTLYVAITTIHVVAGTPLTVRLSKAGTVIESVDVTSGVVDAENLAQVVATLPGTGARAAATYQVEVLLDGASQGVREFSVGI